MSINKIYNIQEWKQVTTVATPSASASIIYPKTDGLWYYMNNDGVEKLSTLSYNIGNGLTYSTATNSYNYNLSVAIDNVTITSSNGLLRVGVLTASNLSLTTATAGYLLSVDATGKPTWILNSSIGAYGLANYVPKYTSSTGLTNSSIYDSGTMVNIATTSDSSGPLVAAGVKFHVNGSIDITSVYLNSSIFTYLSSNNSKITANVSTGFNVTDGTITYLDTNKDAVNGSNFKLLNSLLQLTATGSSNATSSLVLSQINVVGFGTASPTHLLHLFATQSALRLVDTTQGLGKHLISDANGVASWYMPTGNGLSITGYTFSINLNSNSGLTISNSALVVQLPTNSGLTLSNSGLSINSSLAGTGLTFSGGSMSVTAVGTTVYAGTGLTSSSNGTFSIYLDPNGGLTFSAGKLVISPTLAGSGLIFSGGSMSVIDVDIVAGITNSIPYYNTSSTLTSSVIYQSSNNISIGSTSGDGSKLYISGSFSVKTDGIINGANIGRGGSSTNILFGANTLAAISSGSYNVGIGDGVMTINNTGVRNIGIGYLSLSALTSGISNIAIGIQAMTSVASYNENVIIGYSAGASVKGANVGVGAYVLSGAGGDSNSALGWNAGNAATGHNNVYIGINAGALHTGNNTIFIGSYNPVSSAVNSIYISDGAGNLRLYVPSTGNLLLGTMSDNGAMLQIAGSMSIISSNPGKSFQLKDGTEGLYKLLASDANGYATWATTAYAATQSFAAATPYVITHNLGIIYYIIQLWDGITGEEILGGYSSRLANSVTITLSAPVSNCAIMIIA